MQRSSWKLSREFPPSAGRGLLVISRSTAEVLSKNGFYVHEFGTDWLIDIQTYQFSGAKKEKIRAGERKLKQGGFTIEELYGDQVSQSELKKLSDEWKENQGKGSTELRFISRPIVFSEELDVRKFYVLDSNRRVVAFVYFDPIYEGGEVIGYLSNAKRYLPSAPKGFDFAVTKVAIEKFRSEGKRILSLGGSILYDTGVDPAFKSSFVIRKILKLASRWDGGFISSAGMALHKRQYDGMPVKWYIATKKSMPFIELFSLLKINRLF
jgi:phosphatidylglycerol lysyltransferase